MKKATIARFVMGMAAIFAAGCSAETGADGESIGQTSAPLTLLTSTNNPTDFSTSSPDQRARFSASCVLKDTAPNPDVDYIIKAGGYDASGVTGKIVVLKKGAAPATQAATLTQASGDAQMIAISDTECVYVGGTTTHDGATAQKKVDLLTLSVSGGVPTITVTPQHDLNVERSNFVLSKCVDTGSHTHLVAIAGLKSGTGALADIEISDANLANAWTRTASVLAQARYNFGADLDASKRFVVAGGKDTGGTRTAKVEFIRLTSDCAFSDSNDDSTGTAGHSLAQAIDGNVVFYDSNIDKFVVVAGTYLGAFSTPTLYSTGDVLKIDWAHSPKPVIDTVNSTTTTMSAGAYRPSLVRFGASTTAFALVGGSNAAVNASVATVQKYAGVSSWSSAALGTAIYGGIGAWLPTQAELWAAAGDSTPGTLGANVEALSDP